ncbi:SDR family oxidoreductase [Novosphingobium sp. RD2P27]|uniref:SDR family oxidoreductase n=1 Tax=Novosphingobium kalidii TaxID=3230299 RepID=A0ABV2D5P4_9SPHN
MREPTQTNSTEPTATGGDTNRRTFLTGAAIAGAAAAAGPALAQNRGQSSGSDAPMTAQAASFPEPPYPAQQQPWPGLAQRMNPRPDHGEEHYRGTGRLRGKRALITGGDSGIGRAAAIAFLKEGADVAIAYLPVEEPDARDVARIAEREGRRFAAFPGDLRDKAYTTSLPDRTIRELGGLDILVNNAAYQQWVPGLEQLSDEQFDQTMKTNLYAMFWLTKAALPHLRPGSSIINTSSEVAATAPEGLIDYSMTKAGILTFTKSMAKQLASRGIRVNAVAPGPIWTPLQVSGGQPTDQLPQFGSSTPIGRAGQPVELAPLYVALADPALSYSTGQVFGATGGDPQPGI